MLTSRKKKEQSVKREEHSHTLNSRQNLVEIVTMQSIAKIVADATNCFVAKEEKSKMDENRAEDEPRSSYVILHHRMHSFDILTLK